MWSQVDTSGWCRSHLKHPLLLLKCTGRDFNTLLYQQCPLCTAVVYPCCASYCAALLYVIPQVPLPELAGLRRLPSEPSEPSELPSSCTAASSGHTSSSFCRCRTHVVGIGHPIGFYTSFSLPNSGMVSQGAAAPTVSAVAFATVSPAAAAAAAARFTPLPDELPTRKSLLQPGLRYPLQGVRGDHLDIEVTFRYGVG